MELLRDIIIILLISFLYILSNSYFMDIFAHGLWAYAIYHRSKHKWLATFFGMMPDLIAFGFFFISYWITNGFNFSKPGFSGNIPEYVFVGYNFTHSIIIFLIIIGIVYYVTRKIPWYIGGWLLHILIDIPTHKVAGYFPTPFLWPLSNFKVGGISWHDPKFMIINYGTLFFVYVYILVFANKENTKKGQ